MDVHRSRADCMLYLGDITKDRGDIEKADKLWKEACPLFERSLQLEDVARVQNRLARVSLHSYQENLSNLPSTTCLDVPDIDKPLSLLDIQTEDIVSTGQERGNVYVE